jgi:hypothetical protein
MDPINAVFVANPLIIVGPANPFSGFGDKPSFQVLLLPNPATAASNATVGLLTGTLLPSKGTISGKVLIDGKTTSYTGALHGDGSVWFKVGTVLAPNLQLPNQNNLPDKTLTASWRGDGLQVTVTAPGGAVITGQAQPKLSTAPSVLLNRSNGSQGYFTLALSTREPASPEEAATYPQGTGYATITLARAGTFTVAAVLPDGTKVTASSFLVAGAESPVFVPLSTPGANASVKGGSVSGMLKFDTAAVRSDVSGDNWQWFRPQALTPAAKAQTYRSGWPDGILLDVLGGLYQSSISAQTALGLLATDLVNGNARLVLTNGNLDPTVSKPFNLDGNKFVKLDAKDGSYSLSLAPTTGLFKGTFEPNWLNPAKTRPAFQGVVLQKSAHSGGFGFFLSNASGDLNPESGAVILSKP